MSHSHTNKGQTHPPHSSARVTPGPGSIGPGTNEHVPGCVPKDSGETKVTFSDNSHLSRRHPVTRPIFLGRQRSNVFELIKEKMAFLYYETKWGT